MENQNLQNQKLFKDHFVNSLIHVLYFFFFYFLILLPIELWKKATIRLSGQRDSKSLTISQISGLWPFLSFIKRFFLDFLIDGLIFFSFLLGPIIVIAWFIWILSCDNCGNFDYLELIIRMVAVYYLPLLLSCIRDLFQLFILPFRKFISWVSKPAQFMDLEIKNKSV